MTVAVGVHHALYVPTSVNPNLVDVRDFGVVGSGAVDDQPELQAACTQLPDDGVLFIPPGFVCGLAAPVLCQNKENITLAAYGAKIQTLTGSVWTAQQAMLKIDGSRHSHLGGLRVISTLASDQPGAGVVLGRTALKDGTGWRIDDLKVDGKFQVASVYNCGSEVLRVYGGRWYSSNPTVPAYRDQDNDASVLLTNGIAASNKFKHFDGLWIGNQATGAQDTVVVMLNGYQYQVSFRKCYFFTEAQTACHFLRLSDDGSSNVTARLTIHDCDFEQNIGSSAQHAGTRMIYCSKTNGLSGLDLKTEYLKGWNPVGAEYLIEITQAGLTQSEIVYHQGAGAKLVRTVSPAQTRINRIYGTIGVGSIVADGASAFTTENEVHNSIVGNPFAFINGAIENNTGDAIGRQDNIVIASAASDASISVPVIRRRMGVFGNGDATPSVRGLSVWETANTAPTSITGFDTAETGQELTIFVKDANTTFVHTAANTLDTLKLAGGVNWLAPNGAVIRFQRDDRTATGYWREVSRQLPTQEADIGALTDNTGGTADNTIAAIPNPADAPADADALREDIVANLLPPLRNDLADLTEQLNAIRTALRNRGLMA